MRKTRYLLLFALSSLLSACSHNSGKPEALRPIERVDFSGNWEIDYSLKDGVQEKLENYFYRLRKKAERSGQPGVRADAGGLGLTRIGGRSSKAHTVLAMAQFVDEVSRIVVMSIDQTYNAIHIEREETFSLDCEYGEEKPQTFDNGFGEERCGWDGDELVFQLKLPEGLTLQHRFSLMATGEHMKVATTLYYDHASQPFTLYRAYKRFEGVPNPYHCVQTLSKGKVCSRRAPPDAENDYVVPAQ